MKKIISILSIMVVMTLLLSGCKMLYGKKADTSVIEETGENTVEEENKEYLPYIPASEQTTMYVTNCPKSADLLEAPDTNTGIIMSIPHGSAVTLLGVAEKGYYYVEYNNNKGYMLAGNLAEGKPETNALQPDEETAQQEDTETEAKPSPSPAPAAAKKYTSAQIKEMVADIRVLYVQTQSELKSYKRDGFRYYSPFGLVHIDIRAGQFEGTVSNDYNREYYYKDGQLKFAFIYIGPKENRFYFENGKMFRWKDENGVYHNQETENKLYQEWERNILKESEKASS